jgi:hypothetical protein
LVAVLIGGWRGSIGGKAVGGGELQRSAGDVVTG